MYRRGVSSVFSSDYEEDTYVLATGADGVADNGEANRIDEFRPCSAERGDDEEHEKFIERVIRGAVVKVEENSLIECIGVGYYECILLNAQKKRFKEACLDFRGICVKCVKMLRSCDYPMEDILCVFAAAASSLQSVFAQLKAACFSELVHVSLAQVFLAHCWLFDEACPIKEWYNYIFHPYCSHESLNNAVMKLFKIQNWKFSPSPSAIRQCLSFFLPQTLPLVVRSPSPDDTPSTISSVARRVNNTQEFRNKQSAAYPFLVLPNRTYA